MDWKAVHTIASTRAKGWVELLDAGLTPHPLRYEIDHLDWPTHAAELGDLLANEVGPALYSIQFADPQQADLAAALFAGFRDSRERDAKGHKLAVPKVIPQHGGSTCLYVGKCRGNAGIQLYVRMAQHLGGPTLNRRTSALRLSDWMVAELLPLTIHFAIYPSLKQSPSLIEFLEDRLWEKERPLLGRQGGN